MKYVKYQQDLLKILMSNKPIRGFIKHEGDTILITIDACILAIIPDCLWYLDTKRVSEKLEVFDKTLSSIYNESESEPAYCTGMTFEQEKKTLVQIKNKNTEVWVNKDLLRYFENPVFMIRTPVSPVGVYEGDMLVGVVMPTRKDD